MDQASVGSRLRASVAVFLQLVWPDRLSGVVGRVLGAMSILALAHSAFSFGLSSIVRQAFDFYDRIVRFLLGWLDPVIFPLLQAIFHLFYVDIEFNSYWRHVYVVLQLLFIRDAGVAFADGRRRLAVVRFLVGTAVALVVGFASAVRFTGLDSLALNLLFATLPTAGIFLFDELMYLHSTYYRLAELNASQGTPERGPLKFFASASRRATIRLLMGLTATYGVFLVPAVRMLPVPAGGLVAVGVATLINASYWLWRGRQFANEQSRHDEESGWSVLFQRSEAGRFGIALAGALIWAAILIGLNGQLAGMGL